MVNSDLLYEYDSIIIDSTRTITNVKVFNLGMSKEVGKENYIEIVLTFDFEGKSYKKEIEYLNYSVANTMFKQKFELDSVQFRQVLIGQFDTLMKEDK
jgi:hypothetical protein